MGDSDDGTAGGGEWTPPTREEWDAQAAEHETLQARLTKVNAEAKKYRLRARAAELPDDDTDDAGEKPKPKPAAPKPAAQDTAQFDQLKRVAINSAIKSELAAAGFQNATKDRVSRALRMIDTSAVDLDSDGEVDGLDEQIEALKLEFPEFFTAATGGDEKPKPRAARVSASGKTPARVERDSFDRTRTSASRWADMVNGKIDS
jgi:Phage minor structural protein GP20